MSNLLLIGSTGSIGRSVIDVVKNLNSLDCTEKINIVGICAKKNISLLKSQIDLLNPKYAVLIDPIPQNEIQNPKIRSGRDAVFDLIQSYEIDTVFLASSGLDSFEYAIHSINHGKKLLLANKESIVMAGELITKLAHQKKVPIIPVDSEHNAIFQITQSNQFPIRKVILTASGGPFLHLEPSQFSKIKIEDALKHPTWNMGEKITVDSSTLVNKSFEIIEAMWLFGLKPEQIDVLINPQSILHCIVEFEDGTMIAHLSTPDMRLPIQYALTYPNRFKTEVPRVQLQEIPGLEFLKVDTEKFPSIKIGYEVAMKKGLYGAAFCSADEAAVNLFLSKKIRFDEIVPLIQSVLNDPHLAKFENKSVSTENINEIVRWTTERALQWKKF